MQVKFGEEVVEVVDETGEVVEVSPRMRGKVLKEKEFALLTFDAWIDAELTTNESRILVVLARSMDRHGRVIATLAEIAEIVGVARTSAWRIVDSMLVKDVVRRRGRADIYINPHILWRGSLSDRAVARVRWRNEADAKRDGRAAPLYDA